MVAVVGLSSNDCSYGELDAFLSIFLFWRANFSILECQDAKITVLKHGPEVSRAVDAERGSRSIEIDFCDELKSSFHSIYNSRQH